MPHLRPLDLLHRHALGVDAPQEGRRPRADPGQMTYPRTTTTVRWSGAEWEYRCPTCREFWPLTSEFYTPSHGMARCRACWREYQMLYQRRRREDPEVVVGIRASQRAKYQADKERRRESLRRWRAANREHCRAYAREWRKKNHEKALAYSAFHRERAA
jgi:hypothetical protein